MRLNKFINDVLYTNGLKCLICQKEIAKGTKYCLCDKCLKSLPKLTGKLCEKCGDEIYADEKYCVHCKNDMPVFNKCLSPYKFEGSILKLIHNFKYHRMVYLKEPLSELLFDFYKTCGFNCDVVIPVPLNEKRQKERTFNQAELLCCKFENIKVCTDCVIRFKPTKTQTYLTKEERKINLENAFRVVNKNEIKGKNVLIVDDVCTTGATLNSLSKTLFSAGAKAVYALTLAHTILNKNYSTN